MESYAAVNGGFNALACKILNPAAGCFSTDLNDQLLSARLIAALLIILHTIGGANHGRGAYSVLTANPKAA